mgnify:FL=1
MAHFLDGERESYSGSTSFCYVVMGYAEILLQKVDTYAYSEFARSMYRLFALSHEHVDDVGKSLMDMACPLPHMKMMALVEILGWFPVEAMHDGQRQAMTVVVAVSDLLHLPSVLLP